MSSPNPSALGGIDANRIQLSLKAREAYQQAQQIQAQIQAQQEQAQEELQAAQQEKARADAAQKQAQAAHAHHNRDPNEFLLPSGSVSLTGSEFIVKPTYQSQSEYASGHSGTTAPQEFSTSDINPNYRPGSEIVPRAQDEKGNEIGNPVAAAVAEANAKLKAAEDAQAKAAKDSAESQYIFDTFKKSEAEALKSGQQLNSQNMIIVEELSAKNANNPNYKGEQVGDVIINPTGSPPSTSPIRGTIPSIPDNTTKLIYSAPDAATDRKISAEAFANANAKLEKAGGGILTQDMIDEEKQNLLSGKYKNGIPTTVQTSGIEQFSSALSQGYSPVKLNDTKALRQAGFTDSQIKAMQRDKSNIGQEYIYVKPADTTVQNTKSVDIGLSEADQLTFNDREAGRLGLQRLPGFKTDSEGNRIYSYGAIPGRQQFEYVQEKQGPVITGQELQSGLYARDVRNPYQLAIRPIQNTVVTKQQGSVPDTSKQVPNDFVKGFEAPFINTGVAFYNAGAQIARLPEAKQQPEAEGEFIGALEHAGGDLLQGKQPTLSKDLEQIGKNFEANPAYYAGSVVGSGAIWAATIFVPPLAAAKIIKPATQGIKAVKEILTTDKAIQASAPAIDEVRNVLDAEGGRPKEKVVEAPKAEEKTPLEKQMEYYANLSKKNESAYQAKLNADSAAKAAAQSKQFFPVSETQVKVPKNVVNVVKSDVKQVPQRPLRATVPKEEEQAVIDYNKAIQAKFNENLNAEKAAKENKVATSEFQPEPTKIRPFEAPQEKSIVSRTENRSNAGTKTTFAEQQAKQESLADQINKEIEKDVLQASKLDEQRNYYRALSRAQEQVPKPPVPESPQQTLEQKLDELQRQNRPAGATGRFKTLKGIQEKPIVIEQKTEQNIEPSIAGGVVYGLGGNAQNYTIKEPLGFGGRTGVEKKTKKQNKQQEAQSSYLDFIPTSEHDITTIVEGKQKVKTEKNQVNQGTERNTSITSRLDQLSQNQNAIQNAFNQNLGIVPAQGRETSQAQILDELQRQQQKTELATAQKLAQLQRSEVSQREIEDILRSTSREEKIPTEPTSRREIPKPPTIKDNSQFRMLGVKRTKLKHGLRLWEVIPVEAGLAVHPDPYLKTVGLEGSKQRSKGLQFNQPKQSRKSRKK